ncbi:MAG: YjjG family noncanonical pyrimidine nucleotidase [Spirochaetales bacterium]|nr:YjjG family noncanonical pyrimidine nucleotidase [Spirochaetales bacterium]
MKFKLLIFDLDNTLLDYEMAENYALDETFKYFKLESTEELKESFRIINEENWQKLEKGEITSVELRVLRFEQFGRTQGLKWNPNEVSRIYLENLGRGGFIIEGADVLLEDLKKHFRLASVTNGISDVQRARLENSSFDGYFNPLVISDEVGVAKPDPEIFRILLEKANITDKESVLMIGDSLTSDIMGAAAFGIPSCWYNPKNLPSDSDISPDFTITNLEEIRDIVL